MWKRVTCARKCAHQLKQAWRVCFRCFQRLRATFSNHNIFLFWLHIHMQAQTFNFVFCGLCECIHSKNADERGQTPAL